MKNKLAYILLNYCSEFFLMLISALVTYYWSPWPSEYLKEHNLTFSLIVGCVILFFVFAKVIPLRKKIYNSEIEEKRSPREISWTLAKGFVYYLLMVLLVWQSAVYLIDKM